MSSSNTAEATAVDTPNAMVVLEDGQPKVVTQPTKRCQYYRSPRGCFKGNACPLSHSNPHSQTSAARSDSSPPNGSSSSTPGEAPNDQPNRDQGQRQNQSGRGRGRGRGRGGGRGRGRPQLTPEQVKEQAIAQSEAAKAANAKKISIISEDDEQTWSLDREFLSTNSETLDAVLAYNPKKPTPGVKDPIKNIRGLLRFGDNLENLQLDDVSSDDFDVFLAGLRANNNNEFTLQERQTILTLASDWGFEDLRTRTIREIEKLHPSPIERVLLARRCKIQKWIRGAVLSLTILPESLNATEIQIIGTTTAALVWKAREEIFIHRLQALATKDRSTSNAKCAGATCKQAIREAMLRVLEKPGAAGKAESDLVGMVESELNAPQSGREVSPCEACKAGTGLKDGIVQLVEAFKLARIIMEVQLGKDGAKWLEPV